MRHWLALAGVLLWVTAAGAVEVGGVVLPDSARVTSGGPELVLNGAGGERAKSATLRDALLGRGSG